jgi:hypothetical protein
MWERTFERRESFLEASRIGGEYLRGIYGGNNTGSPGYYAVNGYPVALTHIERFAAREPRALIDAAGANRVVSIRRNAADYEHIVALSAEGYSVNPLRIVPERNPVFAERTADRSISTGGVSIIERDGGCEIAAGGNNLRLSLPKFRILVDRLDEHARDLREEGKPRVSIVGVRLPVLVIERQIDWHVHFLQEYAIGGGAVFARWKFLFTAPCLVDAEKPQDLNEQDFAPGGIAAFIETGAPSEVRYDVPFGTETHPNAGESFITAVTHAFLSSPRGGVLVASRTGSQSFRVRGKNGEISVVFGRSATSGGRRKLGFHVGRDVFDVKAETEWYKEPFYGEYTHDFVIHPFSGDWREQYIPVKGRAFASGINLTGTAGLSLSPDNVIVSGVRCGTNQIVLNETCGRKTDYVLSIAGREYRGTISPFGIEENKLG